MKISKSQLIKMEKADLIKTDVYTIDEQFKFGHYDLVDKRRDDGFPRFATVKCASAREGWGMTPLHPSFDKLVFGYVDGCFHPMLLEEKDEPIAAEEIRRGDVTHPEYAEFM